MHLRRAITRGLIAAAPSLAVTFSACASGGPSRGGGFTPTYSVSYRPNEAKVVQHFEATPADTWNALAPAFHDLGYKGGPSTDANERLYMTPTMHVTGRLYDDEWNSAYLDCGNTSLGRPAADSYELSFAVLVWVEPDTAKGSTVRILVDGRGHDRTNLSGEVRCGGTGRLENMFMRAIQRRLSFGVKGS